MGAAAGYAATAAGERARTRAPADRIYHAAHAVLLFSTRVLLCGRRALRRALSARHAPAPNTQLLYTAMLRSRACYNFSRNYDLASCHF